MRLWPKKRPRRLEYVLSWCDCGAQMACDGENRRADCSDIMLGIAIPSGEPGALRHSDVMPFAFWKLRMDCSGKAPVRRDPMNQP